MFKKKHRHKLGGLTNSQNESEASVT